MLGQAGYYLATGLWPFVDERSFQAATGPKLEMWLVKTAGALVTAIGTSLAVAAREPDPPRPETTVLAAGSAAALAGVDIVYVAKGRISSAYLLDAAVELAILAAWVRQRS